MSSRSRWSSRALAKASRDTTKRLAFSTRAGSRKIPAPSRSKIEGRMPKHPAFFLRYRFRTTGRTRHPKPRRGGFETLTPSERLDVFFSMMDVVLKVNPKAAESKDAQPVPGRVLVLELPRS